MSPSARSGGTFDIDGIQGEIESLEKKTGEEGFWDDQEAAGAMFKRISNLKKRLEVWSELEKRGDDLVDMIHIVKEENDLGFFAEVQETYNKLKHDFEAAETITLLSGTDDRRPAIVSIHAGAGGTEAQDWAGMLLRMYLRWAENHGFGVKFLDETAGEEAGIKSITFIVEGEYAAGLLKAERGVHRLVRLSPFDQARRRHTSFASVDVVPAVEDDIVIEIDEGDLKIDTYRASGAGGQHVNKTDSAVRITHKPTGVVVQCQNERSQHNNRVMAMKILRSRLYEMEVRKREAELAAKHGDKSDIAFGNQIRSYVFHPYHQIKDLRTGMETSNTQRFMDGEIDEFIYAYLRSKVGESSLTEPNTG